jgi:hypothetical protein
MRLDSAKMMVAVAAAFFLVCAVGGCAGPEKRPEVPGGEGAPGSAPQAPGVKAGPPQEPTYFVHTVKWPNESLSIIAAWYTGVIDNWKLLVPVNPELDPNRIYIGNKVRIPEEMLKTREPITQEFVESLVPKPKKAPPAKQKASSGEAPPPEPDFKLYGPKQ